MGYVYFSYIAYIVVVVVVEFLFDSILFRWVWFRCKHYTKSAISYIALNYIEFATEMLE